MYPENGGSVVRGCAPIGRFGNGELTASIFLSESPPALCALGRAGRNGFPPPVQVIYVLRQAIREFFEGGADNRYARYRRNWEMLAEGVKQMGLKRYGEDQPQSGILMAILEPEDPRYDFGKMHDRLDNKGITIYPGKLPGEHTFRLSIMGAITPDDITLALEKLRERFREVGVTIN